MRLAAFAALALLSGFGACREQPFCYDGEYRGCRCAGAIGYQRCESEHYDACVCDGTTPGLVPASASSGGGLALLAPCHNNGECASGICGDFPAKGSHCTKTCHSDGDCPEPSPGCNPKGQCKLN